MWIENIKDTGKINDPQMYEGTTIDGIIKYTLTTSINGYHLE